MKRSTCLTTIGVGCGLILLIVILLAVAGWLFTRDTMRGIDATIEARSELEQRHGEAERFTPWLDGAIPGERMEAFLRVRETLVPALGELAGALDSFPPSDDAIRELERKPVRERIGFLFGASRSMIGFPGHVGRFTEARNRALLDAGMGQGEYTYVYVVAYYSWLALLPEDGAWASERVRRTVLDQLRNQLAALPDPPDPELSGWREALAAEIELMEGDPLRPPWRDGLPAPLAASLKPYRERLEAAYAPAVAEHELTRIRRRGMTIHSD